MRWKIAIIVGSEWQDWTFLSKLLHSKGYATIWIWIDRTRYYWIPLAWDIIIDILNKEQVELLIKTYKPDELYYLAAYHHSSQDILPDDFELLIQSRKIHVDWYFNLLRAIQQYSPNTKICYASSSLIFWGSNTKQQNELTLPVPNSIYGITKLEGMHIGSWFAGKHGLQVINVILYNHESELRSSKFVSMKIIEGAINISKWLQDKITLWDLSTQVDRGYAWDYVEAMRWLLQTTYRWDYIVSSWKLHTIQDMVEIVFGHLKLNWKQHIETDQNIIKRQTEGVLFGDNSKIKKDIWWGPSLSFNEMLAYIITVSK